MLSFTFKFNNLPAVCFSRDSPAPLVHRQTAESVGNLTQHKLHCEAEVSESVGCISDDRGTMKMWKPFISSHFKGCGEKHMCLTRARCVRYGCVGCSHSKKTKYRVCGLFRHCLYENGLHRTVSRLSSDRESKVLWKVWGKDDSDPVGLNFVRWIKGNQKPFFILILLFV